MWLGIVGLLACGCAGRATGSESGGDATGGDPTSATDPSSPTDPSGTSADTGSGPGPYGVQLTVSKDVDILFVIDNSGSMGEEQGRLAGDIAALVAVLEDPAVRANYRIGFTTTDNGNPWCGSTSPEAGKLQMSSCRGRTGDFVFNGNPPADASAIACTDVCNLESLEIVPTTTEFDPDPKPRPWIEYIEGRSNLGDVTSVAAMQCAAPQGIAGCGFESHLESMYKALLRAQNADEEQYGFLRSNAILSIVIVTDEVDCSYNDAYQSIFLPADQGGDPGVFWSDPEASAPTSAVCWNAGVVCEGSGTPYDSCRSSNKDVTGASDVSDNDAVLHPLSRYVDFVQEIEVLKQQYTPSQEVLVSVIAGVPDGYDGTLTYSNSLDPIDQNDFGIGPGCTYDDVDPMTPVQTARPPVRMREFAEQFEVGDGANLYSVCQDTYSDALSAVANSIRDQIKPACMPVCVADTDPVSTGLQPECTLVQQAPEVGSGEITETVVEPCLADGTLPDAVDVCYVALVDDALSDFCDDMGWNLEFQLVRRPGVPAPGGTSVGADCTLSQNKAIDCPDLP
ncbi:MAG: VWA domain-containing protein [Myxococcales bacterium]|nr:VWA domain-containing protein [Myxococcales bacterium]